MELEYVAASSFRFFDKGIASEELLEIYNAVKSGESVNLAERKKQLYMFREQAASYQA